MYLVWKIVAAAGAVAVATACGGTQPTAANPPSAGTAPSESVAAQQAATAPVASAEPGRATIASQPETEAPGAQASPAWKDMSRQERKEFMKSTVLPKMKQLFIGYNAHDFSDMNCATCHGAGVHDGSFKMPNPQLPKLPSDEAGFRELMKNKPEATQFMGKQVVPTMARFVDQPPYDPATHEGFGCFACHTKK